MIRLLVLELLSQSPMSGYEIKQILEKTDAKRWGNVLPGSIYHAIKKLELSECIKIANIEMTGKRQRSEYTITKKGTKLLSELVIEALSSPIHFAGDLYSGIGVIHQVGKDQAIAELEKNLITLDKEAAEIKQGIKMKIESIDAELPTLSSLVVEHMIKSIDIQKELIKGVIHTLENKTE
ncbi:hypothetical protein IGI37_001035 [Enterococcus sp. AZ194]|uniref:PadR family transcriptional regulator n=1 Tax=Enterococcus sp. AZ194 TaxID=2774629 RepID=UPI003F29E329